MKFLWLIFSLCTLLFVYHHFCYPTLLRWLAPRAKRYAKVAASQDAPLKIGILICAYNEERYIREKLDNLAMLNYPPDSVEIHIGLDGCTDNTESFVDLASEELIKHQIRCTKHVFKHNQGKVKLLNHLITETKGKYDVLLFTDVSALISIDALQTVAQSFSNAHVGVVSGDYQFLTPVLPEQDAYWKYQNQLKQNEGALGAVIGVPGAMYAIRTNLVKPIPANTINDDFVIPMRAIEMGFEAIVEPDLGIVELQSDTDTESLKRRIRIGAGNLQQLWLLRGVLTIRNGWRAFNFFSGKGLRALMPIILLVMVCCLFTLGLLGNGYAQVLALVGMSSLLVNWCVSRVFGVKNIPLFSQVAYLGINYLYAFIGIVKMCLGHYKKSWKNSALTQKPFVPMSVRLTKRAMDIGVSTIGLIALSPIAALIAILVKLTSPGPVIVKQLCVGAANLRCISLFYMYKFRTTYEWAENKPETAWPTPQGSRVTKIGKILRNTRLNELPQLWNVLIGEMSLIGPRPERPKYHNNLELHIPLFTERTQGVRPGISGLAQTKMPHADDIAAVRKKLEWDMAYTLVLSNPKEWLKLECKIILATLKMMLLAKKY